MSDKFFIDTNIFIYTFDHDQAEKRTTAHELIQAAMTQQNGCISFQVIQEFLNVATGKFETPLRIRDCEKYLNNVLLPLCQVYPSVELYRRALEVMERWQFSFFDSLIVAAALEANCDTLYSEDLQHQQRIQGLTIINPFAES